MTGPERSVERVFVISSGSYSDYRVHCVVDGDRAAAEQLAARANASSGYKSYDVEELGFVSPDVQRIEILRMQVNLWDDGTESEDHVSVRVEWPFDLLFDGKSDPAHWRWVRAPIHHGKGGRLEVYGTDHERVRKVYGDQRAALKTDSALRARKEMKR